MSCRHNFLVLFSDLAVEAAKSENEKGFSMSERLGLAAE